jgi:hypothetical protein
MCVTITAGYYRGGKVIKIAKSVITQKVVLAGYRLAAKQFKPLKRLVALIACFPTVETVG